MGFLQKCVHSGSGVGDGVGVGWGVAAGTGSCSYSESAKQPCAKSSIISATANSSSIDADVKIDLLFRI